MAIHNRHPAASRWRPLHQPAAQLVDKQVSCFEIIFLLLADSAPNATFSVSLFTFTQDCGNVALDQCGVLRSIWPRAASLCHQCVVVELYLFAYTHKQTNIHTLSQTRTQTQAHKAHLPTALTTSSDLKTDVFPAMSKLRPRGLSASQFICSLFSLCRVNPLSTHSSNGGLKYLPPFTGQYSELGVLTRWKGHGFGKRFVCLSLIVSNPF